MNSLASQHGAARPLQLAGLLFVLLVSWALWSGIYKPLLLGLGVFSAILSAWLGLRMGFFRHAIPARVLLRLPAYWLWLLRDIVKSSLEVARVVLTPSLPISPTVIELTTEESTEAGKVILGNSITLSPGTVTIDVDGDRMLVHCLTREGAAALQQQEVQRRTAKLGMG